jgi:RNA polymerase sigma factor (sigma-70 family)
MGSGQLLVQLATDTVRDSVSDETGDALMMRVARRDAAAFRTLIDQHASMVHRIAYRMLLDASEAEDIAQEAMLRLWNQAPNWQAGSTGVAAWLNRVAVNLCFDRLRRRKFVSDADIPDLEDEDPRADRLIDAARLREATIACVQALPERQRAAIILTYYEDQSNGVAAQCLDMNIKAFESLLLRARRALRDAMTETGLMGEGGAQ